MSNGNKSKDKHPIEGGTIHPIRVGVMADGNLVYIRIFSHQGDEEFQTDLGFTKEATEQLIEMINKYAFLPEDRYVRCKCAGKK